MKKSAYLFALALLLGGCKVTDSVGNSFKKVTRSVSGGASTSSSSQEGKRVYFVVEERGQRRSTGYRVWQNSAYNGHPCIVLQSVKTTELMRDGTTFSKTVHSKTITATDSTALYALTVEMSGDERTQEEVTIREGKAMFEAVGPGGTKRQTLEVPRETLFSIDPRWLVNQELQPGKQFQAPVLDRSARRVALETAVINGKTTDTAFGSPADVWSATTRQEGREPVTMIFTASGELIRLEAEDMVVRIVSKEEAEKPAPPVTISTDVPIDFSLPAWDYYNILRYRAEPADLWRKYLKKSEYVDVLDDGLRLEVTLKKTAPSLRSRSTLPMEIPREIQPYLQATGNIFSDKTDIQKRAQAIIGEEKDALVAVALLAGWIHQTITFGQRSSLNPSPLSTMENRRGDCSEHADLFASFARSLGIPTRHCRGLLIQKNSAVYHTWVEAWVGGNWVPADTTVSRVGLPAGYLLTARGTGDGVPEDEFAWQIRKGGISLQMMSASRYFRDQKETFTLYPDQKKTFVVARPDDLWFANIYWGFSLTRPEAWQGSIKMDRVDMTSPDKLAKFKCEAIGGSFRATRSGLESLVDSLDKSLDGFKVIDARIVSFGNQGRTDALMVDFACSQSGSRLRCRQYVIPKRDRSYRISAWALEDSYSNYMQAFKDILNSVEL